MRKQIDLSNIVLALRPWGLYDLVWPYIAKSPSYMLFIHIFSLQMGSKKALKLPKNSARNSRITGLRMRGEQPILAGFFSRAFCFSAGCVHSRVVPAAVRVGGPHGCARPSNTLNQELSLSRLSQLTHTHTLMHPPRTQTTKKKGKGQRQNREGVKRGRKTEDKREKKDVQQK